MTMYNTFATIDVHSEVLQSGFGVNVGLAKFRKIASEFLSEFFQQIFPAIFRPCFSRVSEPPPPPQKDSRPKFTPKIVSLPLQFHIF